MRNIREVEQPIIFKGIHGNGKSISIAGEFYSIADVYIDKEMEMNIIAFSDCIENGSIMYYNDEDIFVWTTSDSDSLVFRNKAKLYVWDNGDHAYINSSTVEENKRLFTKKEQMAARDAREFLRRLGYPAPYRVAEMIRKGYVLPISTRDLINAEAIYGKPIAMLKGKTVAKRIKLDKDNPIPKSILSPLVLIQCDIMFVCGLAFLLSVSIPLHLTVATKLREASRAKSAITEALRSHTRVYTKNNFRITKIVSDKEGGIAASEEEVPGISFEPRSTHAHVCENKVKYVKGNARSLIYSLKYKLPKHLLQFAVLYAVYVANLMPSEGGLRGIIPREALLGQKVNFKYALPIGFGDYAQVKYKTDVSDNTMKERTFGGIALLPTGNVEGAVKFLNLSTGAIVTSVQFEVLPIPDEIISFMNYLGERYPYDKKDLDIAEDETIYEDGINKDLQDTWNSIISQERSLFSESPTAVDPIREVTIDEQPLMSEFREEDMQVEEEIVVDETEREREQVPDESEVEQDLSSQGQHQLEVESSIPTSASDRLEEALPSRYNLRDRSKIKKVYQTMDLSKAINSVEAHPAPIDLVKKVFYNQVINETLVLSNMSIKEALSKMPVEAENSISAEISQLLQKRVFHPVDTNGWSREALKSVIPSMMFLKEKYLPNKVFEKLKSRLVAGGHRQNMSLYDTKDISSPTASMFALFALATLWAKERRKVVAFDITGAYLNASMSEGNKIYMRIDKDVARVLCKLDASYSKFLTVNGSVVVQLDKALYGLVEAAKLWYDNISEALISIGFERNPTEKCVFNKVDSKGVQCTVVLYVDDSKVASESEELIDEVRILFKSKYKEVGERGGKIIPFLGMIFDYSVDGEVSISMPKYVEDYLKKYQSVGRGKTPASESLFSVSEDSPKVSHETRESFHSEVATILFLSYRIRGDIMFAISFLSTRVRDPTIEDLKKLERLRDYIAETKDAKLRLRTEDGKIRVYIDSSYGIHPDMRSHSGLTISMGEGSIISKSRKQKINTKSSSEAELIAVSDLAGWCTHCEEFLMFQGYKDSKVILFQDNESSIKLLLNGKESSGDGTKHIKNREYWLKDYIDRERVSVQYLPTREMRADILTKPLQGSLFQYQRELILGEKVTPKSTRESVVDNEI